VGPGWSATGLALDELERLAIPALHADADVVVVDELGKMELASAAFRDAVIAPLERPVAVVATVHARPHPFTDELKRRPSVAVMRFTPSHRDEAPAAMVRRLRGDRRRG
jgi:nucleoside-triphosphatase